MNTRPPSPTDTDAVFDQSMRQRYAHALQALPPSTAGALRAARRTALDPASHARTHHPALRWAGAFATVAALAGSVPVSPLENPICAAAADFDSTAATRQLS